MSVFANHLLFNVVKPSYILFEELCLDSVSKVIVNILIEELFKFLLDGLKVDAVDIEGVEVLDKYGWLKDKDSGITTRFT